MCWYLWVLIGSFSQQAQSQIPLELNMQPLPAQPKSTSARSFVTQAKKMQFYFCFRPLKVLLERNFVALVLLSAAASRSFLPGLALGLKLFWFNPQKINNPSTFTPSRQCMQIQLRKWWQWIGFDSWWWWCWWMWEWLLFVIFVGVIYLEWWWYI